MPEKVLITGINGSGGSYLAEYCVNIKGAHVIGPVREKSNTRNLNKIREKIDLYNINLEDYNAVYKLIEKTRPTMIFHLASNADVRGSFDQPVQTFNGNMAVTLSVLEAVRKLKQEEGYNPKIQICSTSEVYGKVDPKFCPITEECPLKPINPYAVSKMAQDNFGYVYFLCYGLNIVRTRMFTYLNARRANLFATAFAKQILEIKQGKRTVLNHGNLDSTRSFIDVREVAEAYWIANEKCPAGEVYNIGGSNSIKIGKFLEILIDKMKVPVKTYQDPSLMRPSDTGIQVPDMSKFTKQTGWKPTISFEDSMDYFIKELEEYWT